MPPPSRWTIFWKNLCKSAFILNFQVTLLGFRRTLRSTPLFFKFIGETEEVLSKGEEEKLNQARYDCCLSTEHHSTCQPLWWLMFVYFEGNQNISVKTSEATGNNGIIYSISSGIGGGSGGRTLQNGGRFGGVAAAGNHPARHDQHCWLRPRSLCSTAGDVQREAKRCWQILLLRPELSGEC